MQYCSSAAKMLRAAQHEWHMGTERPLHARNPEENEFVRAVLFSEDIMGYSAFCIIASSQDCDEYLKLLYKVNGSYLLQKPVPFVWNV
jgi:hypothetical protein